MEPASEYSPDVVEIYRGGEHIRVRPQLYVGPLPNPAVINRLVQDLSATERDRRSRSEPAARIFPSRVVPVPC